MRSRADALAAIAAERFDVLVIGGGITGAGVALDAASRGYSVALVEQADYASGTSSRSSKLVHGGLRYLQNFDLGLVREALLERRLMVRLAPHLVRPLPMIVPAFEGAHPDRMVGIGLNMYDVMSVPLRGRRRGRIAQLDQSEASWSPDRHRMISGDEVSALLPALADRQPTGGYLFYDCQTDDARLVLTVLGEAERFGAICANRARVTALRAGHDGATVVHGVPKETAAGEHRVGLVPEVVRGFCGDGHEVVVQRGAGAGALIPDEAYADAGRGWWTMRRTCSAPMSWSRSRRRTRRRSVCWDPDSVLIGFLGPLTDGDGIRAIAATGATSFALEAVPRISRAQSMDALSSQANIAGLPVGVDRRSGAGPLLPDADDGGGHHPARDSAGVGGGRRRPAGDRDGPTAGAVVQGFDVRSAVKEQVESLGAKFLEFDLGGDLEGAGGYARELTAEQQAAPAGADGRGDRQVRRRDHHRSGPRPARADPGDRGGGEADEAGVGDR